MKILILILIMYCSGQAIFAQNDSEKTTNVEGKTGISQGAAATTTPVIYDFTTGADKYHGGAAGAQFLGYKVDGVTEVWGMVAGDGDGNGGINIDDRNLIWRVENGSIGYKAGDYDMNGGVNIDDLNLIWRKNNGKVSLLP